MKNKVQELFEPEGVHCLVAQQHGCTEQPIPEVVSSL